MPKPRPTPQPTPTIIQPSMLPDAWYFYAGFQMPLHPSPLSPSGWQFDFPPDDGASYPPQVDYLLQDYSQDYSSPITAASLRMSGSISATAGTEFNGRTEATNTGPAPAAMRFILIRALDANPFNRWFADVSLVLAAGAYTYTLPLTPDRWKSVDGRFANSSSDALAGFNLCKKEIRRIGVCFGGGNFAGHGVNVRNGTASLACSEFKFV